MTDELARVMRDGMAAEARGVSAGPEFTERVIGRALATGAPGGPDRRPPGWQNWILPAVAAAVVALLVGSVLLGTKLLHSAGPASQPSPSLNQPTVSSPPPSNQTSPAPSSPAPSNSAPSTPTSGTAAGPKGGPVPAGFRGYDLTWVSNDLGWALGSAPCGNPPCTSILRTQDGGKSWVGIPAPRAFLTEYDTCNSNCDQVSHLRFANPLVGYAYGPNAFYMTTDGGASWHQQSGGYAYGLEVVAGSVFRVSAQAAGCAPGCDFRLQRSAIGSDSWQDVALPAGGRNAAAELAVSDRTMVLATYANPAGGAEDATSVLFISTDAGANWHRVGEPCPRQFSNEMDTTAVTVAPDDSISLLCVLRGPNWEAGTVTSTDGTHFEQLRPAPASDGIGAISAHHLYLLGGVNGFYESTDSGQQAVPNGPPVGYYIGFESTTVGRVIGSDHSGGGREGTWTTTDGGQSWTYHSFG
jgi:photosystem II stability/assembly factor-like uncharacterized protein